VTLEVIDPGLLMTVQDAGRPDWTHLGVPVGGACDPWSLAVANLLVGADAGAAALEMTIAGPTLAVREATTIGLAGADLGGVVRETGRRLLPGRSHALAAGTTIAFPGGTAGARAYLAVPGGVEVPDVLGSAATLLSAGFGGIDGRALRQGDMVAARVGRTGAGTGSAAAADERAWPWIEGAPDPGSGSAGGATAARTVRLVPGPAPGVDALLDGEWLVGPDSDRVGLRLVGPPISTPSSGAGELLSHGVVFGAVQLPPGGQPLVLLADHQTTGGYPVAAVVARADRPLLGQLRPGATIRFGAVTPDEARAAFVAQTAALARGAAALRGDDAWDELWRSAGR
jgi:antagonist of KipI